MTDYTIRQATAADAEVIAHHRTEMFRAMGMANALDEVEVTTRRRLAEEIASGDYRGWLVEYEGAVVAGAGVLLYPFYPSAANPRGRPTAYVLNVYTEPDHRRRGLARQVVETIVQWCRANDIPRVSLHASDAGRAVYEQLGFIPTNELRLELTR